MGSIWTLNVRGRTLIAGKNYLPDQLMLLFNDDDRRIDIARFRRLDDEWERGQQTAEAERRLLYTYRTSVDVLRKRLALQGFRADQVRRSANAFLEAEQRDPERYIPDSWLPIERSFATTDQLLAELVRVDHDGIESLRLRLKDRDERALYFHSMWESLSESFDDPRFALTLHLSQYRGNAQVVLDLTDLLLGGWIEAQELPHRTAKHRLSSEVSASGPVIVVTEGSTDASILTRSMSLAEPDLAPAFSFLDFAGTSAPGGVDRAVNLVRGLAAAGVMNRIVVILDNDTAGSQGVRSLRHSSLPPNIKVARLPNVPYGRAYPTDGPDGRKLARINGRAVSIEMMFGESILRESNGGSLPPVRWTGFVAGESDYQGEVIAKRNIQQTITSRMGAERLVSLPPEVQAGCRRLSRMLLSTAAGVTPTMATENSPLLTARVQTDEGAR